MSEIAQRFERLHPRVKVDVHAGGSGKGVADVRAGASDIGLVSRPLLDSERDLYPFPIARDGVALVVHRENPVSRISSSQLRSLLTGRLTSWRLLGGRDLPVNLLWRGQGQGSAEFILELLALKQEQVGPHNFAASHAAAINLVAHDSSAVALTSVGESERSASEGTPIKLLAYNGVAGGSASIRNNSYPLARPLTLVTRRLPDGLQKHFIDYALSSSVNDLYLKHDFVPYPE